MRLENEGSIDFFPKFNFTFPHNKHLDSLIQGLNYRKFICGLLFNTNVFSSVPCRGWMFQKLQLMIFFEFHSHKNYTLGFSIQVSINWYTLRSYFQIRHLLFSSVNEEAERWKQYWYTFLHSCENSYCNCLMKESLRKQFFTWSILFVSFRFGCFSSITKPDMRNTPPKSASGKDLFKLTIQQSKQMVLLPQRFS